MFIETADSSQYLNINHIESLTVHQGDGSLYIAARTSSGQRAVIKTGIKDVEEANHWVFENFSVQ